MVVSVRSAMVFRFCARHVSKRWFLKITQVTMKHDPLDAMEESMWTSHPSCIHIVLCWSLERSVKRTWTGSVSSTNESAWSVMVMGSHSCVWSGPDNITSFRPIAMLCGSDNIIRTIPHIQAECEEYSTEYCQSHITLLWAWIMLWEEIARGIR